MSSMVKRADIAHARRFASASRQWASAIDTPNVLEAITWFDSEISNLTLAFHRVSDVNDLYTPELARDFALALFPYLDRASMWTKWEREFGLPGIAAAESLKDEQTTSYDLPRLQNALGIARRMQGQAFLSSALALFEQALQATTDDGVRADALVNLADVYRLQGNTEAAIAAAHKSIAYGESAHDLNRQAKGWEYLGLAWLPEDYDKAIECYDTAVELRKQTGNVARLAQALTMLAYGLTHRGRPEDLKRALLAYEQSAEFDKQIHNWQALGRYWGDIAATYNKLGTYQSAIDNSMYALDRNLQIHYKRGEILNYIRLAESHYMLGDSSLASHYVNLAFQSIDAISGFDRRIMFPRFRQVTQNLASYIDSNQLQGYLATIDKALGAVPSSTGNANVVMPGPINVKEEGQSGRHRNRRSSLGASWSNWWKQLLHRS